MATMQRGDEEILQNEGWEIGAYGSGPGWEGYYLRHPKHHPKWVLVRTSPCSDDALEDEEGFIGPSGEADTATAALLDRLYGGQDFDDDNEF